MGWPDQELGTGWLGVKVEVKGQGSGVRTHISSILSRISLVSLFTHRPSSSRWPLGRAAGLSQTFPTFRRFTHDPPYCLSSPLPQKLCQSFPSLHAFLKGPRHSTPDSPITLSLLNGFYHLHVHLLQVLLSPPYFSLPSLTRRPRSPAFPGKPGSPW